MTRLALGRNGRLISQEMSVPGFAGARLAGKDGGEWACWGLGAGFGGSGTAGQAFQGGLDGLEVVEGIETIGSTPEFARSLRAAKHQETKDSGFVAPEIENGADTMFVFGNPGVSYGGYKSKVFQRVNSLTHFIFRQIEHRIAARTLVARVDESVQRQGIVFRSNDLFFDQGAENTELDRIEMHNSRVP